MHGISTFDAKMKVKELQRKSLIYESSPTLRTHDLYIEFARSVVSLEGSKENEWWVVHKDANGYNPTVKRLVLFENASKISHPPKQLWDCQNLESLIMYNCTLKSNLDLKCFSKLRVLMIANYTTNEDRTRKNPKILCTCGGARYCNLCFYWWKDQDKGCLSELRMVQLYGFDLKRIPFLRHCWNLTFLSVDDCDFDILDFNQDGTTFFENLKALETLILSSTFHGQFPCCVFDVVLQGATELKNLKCLEIDFQGSELDGDGFCKLDVSPLGCLTSLETLSLPNLQCIEELMGLDQLSQLIELNLQYSQGLRKLPNLDLLPNLRRICVCGCLGLKHPEDQLKRFQELHTWHQCLNLGSRFRYPRITRKCTIKWVEIIPD